MLRQKLGVFYILMLSLFSLKISATTFEPITIKTHIKESDALISGEVSSIENINKDGLISRKISIDLDKWVGFEVESNNVDIYAPGGEIDGTKFHVTGAPKFTIGEKVVVFINLIKDEFWVSNLGLGKYSVKRIGKRKIIVNQIFPGKPGVGQMDLQKFFELSEWVRKQKFTVRFKNKYEIHHEKVVSQYKKMGRGIASIESSDSANKSEEKIPAYWLVIILGVLGVGFQVIRKRLS